MTNRAIHNFSSKQIDPKLLAVLGLGLKYIPVNKPPSADEFQIAFDDYRRQLRLHALFGSTERQDGKQFVKQFYIANTEFEPLIINAGLERYLAFTWQDLNDAIRESRRIPVKSAAINRLREFLKDPELIVRPCDKNLGLAILNRRDYVEMVMEHLNDATVYQKELRAHDEIVQETQSQLEPLCREIQEEFTEIVSIDKFMEAAATKTTIPAFHAIPKIHKSPMKGRPIAGAVNWLTTNASAFLAWLLKPIIDEREFILRDSKSIIQPLEALEIPEDAILVSFDITALYPSMDQERTIQAVRDLFPTRQNTLHERLTRFVLTNSYVEFEGEIYKQIDGMAMGTNAAVQLANLYASELIERDARIRELIARMTRFYGRFIDDMFLVWTGSKEELMAFYAALNQLHPRLKFTMEQSTESIAFLDLLVTKRGNRLHISTFQKTMNRYLYIPAQSAHPIAAKRGFIKGELIRYARNSTTEDAFEMTRSMFRQRLLLRGYAHSFLNQCFSAITYADRMEYLEKSRKREYENTDAKKAFFKIRFHPDIVALRLPSLLRRYRNQIDFDLTITPVLAYRKDKNIAALCTRSRLTPIAGRKYADAGLNSDA